MKSKGYDVFGNIVVLKFSKEVKARDKKQFAEKFLKENKPVTTVLEKTGKFKGRLRKMQTRYIAGERTKEALYRENGCVFRFNIDTTYFSPRLSNERKEIAKAVRKGENVLVMFAGAAPYSVVIAKNSKAGKVVSNEINKEANKYARLNVELNKLKKKIEVVPGDIKKVVKKLKKKFDVIVMPRPQLKDSFLREAFMLSKKGTRVYYYDFCKQEETQKIVEKVKSEAKRARKKIKLLKIKSAGEIAPYKIRVRVDFRVL
jgi:tRNA (guanine37-N1)-methyltransferase